MNNMLQIVLLISICCCYYATAFTTIQTQQQQENYCQSTIATTTRNHINNLHSSSSSSYSISSKKIVVLSSTTTNKEGGGGEQQKSATAVTGEELELLLQDFDLPLVVDAFATWCGPCLLMAPEFEEAAKDLHGKVRFVKLDTDKEENMAGRLNIMGLPTLLFLDKFTAADAVDDASDEATTAQEQQAKAVLKGRIEGAMRKQNIIDLCNYYFFNGPEPKL